MPNIMDGAPYAVSRRDWRYALNRLRAVVRWIDQGRAGDPLDDVWFDLDSRVLEIGVKPAKGIFLGEAQEFHLVDDEKEIFDAKKFQAIYEDFVKKGFFIEDDSVDIDEHPLQGCVDALLNGLRAVPRAKRLKTAIWSSMDFKRFKCFEANKRDPEYPALFMELREINEDLDKIPTCWTFEEISETFDVVACLKGNLLKPGGPVDYVWEKFLAADADGKGDCFCAVLNRGLNKAEVVKSARDVEVYYPFYGGSFHKIREVVAKPYEVKNIDVCKASLANMFWVSVQPRCADERGEWGWSRSAY